MMAAKHEKPVKLTFEPIAPASAAAPEPDGGMDDVSFQRKLGAHTVYGSDSAMDELDAIIRQAARYTAIRLADPPADEDGARFAAFDAGWHLCARWMNRDDLHADTDSPAYARDKARALAALATPAKREVSEAGEALLITNDENVYLLQELAKYRAKEIGALRAEIAAAVLAADGAK